MTLHIACIERQIDIMSYKLNQLESSLIQLQSSQILLKSALIELESSPIELESSLFECRALEILYMKFVCKFFLAFPIPASQANPYG